VFKVGPDSCKARTFLTAQNYLRFDCPRAAFFSFCLFSPRAPTRGPFGAAFFRAARLIFFRSNTSSTALVFAIFFSFLKSKIFPLCLKARNRILEATGGAALILELFQLCELLNQLLHAEFREMNRQFGVSSQLL
jgi:hypothetical protein